MFKWKVEPVSYAIEGEFRISRGAKTKVEAIRVTLEYSNSKGVGEAVPYARFNESISESIEEIESMLASMAEAPSREQVLDLMKPGAARNALDAALWDLECKRLKVGISDIVPGLHLTEKTTAYTISIDTPENMYNTALKANQYPLLKLKVAGENDLERLSAVRKARPDASIILDANEAWDRHSFQEIAPHLSELGVVVLEQPAPETNDDFLTRIEGIDICADESVTDLQSLKNLNDAYTMINIKLDKAGGLTHALQMIGYAKGRGMKVMIGCMLGSSLSMAPAFVAAQYADYVDLDGPLLLREDCENPIAYNDAMMQPPSPLLWG